MNVVLFRTDASPAVGTGHAMRCLALAEHCLLQGLETELAFHHMPPAILERLHEAGIRTHQLADGADADELLRLLDTRQVAAVVMDGYHFDADYRSAIHKACPVLTLDDGNLMHQLHADIVLNSSPNAQAALYRKIAPAATLLLGPAYAPLRREFLEQSPTPTQQSNHLLISFGGSDPMGLTVPVVDRLSNMLPEHVHLDVVVGGATEAFHAIENQLGHIAARITLHRDARNMAKLMADAQLAVSAAGSTLWELAYMGVPTIAIVVADNQQGTLNAPMKDWFDVVDARTDAKAAVESIADAVNRLFESPATLAEHRASLCRIAVGSRTSDVCAILMAERGKRND